MKNTCLFLACLLLSLTACRRHYDSTTQATKNIADTAKPVRQDVNGQPFGRYFHFDGAFFSQRLRKMVATQYMVSDSEIFRVFDYVKLQDKHAVDSMKRLFPKAMFTQSAFKSPLLFGVKLNPGSTDFLANSDGMLTSTYSGYHVSDSSDAVLVAIGINETNVKDYRYHVIENDNKEIVPWSVPPLQQLYGAKRPYAFLGRYKAPGKQLKIEVFNNKNYSKADGIIFDWRASIKPVIGQILINTPRENFNLLANEDNHKYATKFEPETGLPLNFKFPAHVVSNLIVYMREHGSALYAVYLIRDNYGRPDTTLLENSLSRNTYSLNHKYFNEPGNYQLVFQPTSFWDNFQVTSLKFRVLPAPVYIKRYAIRQIAPYMILLLLAIALSFVVYYRYNTQQINKADQQKTMVNLQLKSIRSQLNPHFMFNALSAIQNLMNKPDIEGANHYLAKFAGLTRKVLNSSEREMISVEDEIAILDDYLQMEQLRFGFQYKIEVDEAINKANTEIPAMLLQPFIENSVKHGVAVLQQEGLIRVMIKLEGKDLDLLVQDNGAGFDVNDPAVYDHGFGLKLSRERMALLNQVYHKRALFKITSTPGNTTIAVKLIDWLI